MKLHYKTPLPFVLGILVNIVLIVTIEVLLIYRFPVPLGEESLSHMDPRYDNCTILDGDDSYMDMDCLLVETAQGQRDLIPVKRHPFFYSRLRIYENKISRNVSVGDRISHFFGLRNVTVEVAEDYAVTSHSGGTSGIQATLTYYLALSGILTFLEQFLWEKIRGE